MLETIIMTEEQELAVDSYKFLYEAFSSTRLSDWLVGR